MQANSAHRKYIIALFFLIFFHSIFNYIWLKNDYNSFYQEKFYRLHEEHTFYLHLKEETCELNELARKIYGLFKAIFWKRLWSTGLFYVYTAGLNCIAGSDSMNNAILWNLPYMSLALVFVYLIGRELASPGAGLLSSFILSFYPGFYGMSRSYGIDFPVIAMMAVILYYFVRIEIFFQTRHALKAGIAAFFAVLINARSVFFLCGPVIYFMSQMMRRILSLNPKEKKGKLLGMAAVLLLVAIITIPWWYNIREIQKSFLIHFSIAQFERLRWHTALQWMQHLLTGMSGELSIFSIVLLCCGAVLFRNNRHVPLFAFYCIAPFCILPFFTASFDRYFFPIFVGFALITGIGLTRIRHYNARRSIILIVVSISVMQFFDLSFGTRFLPEKIFHRVKSSWAKPPEVNDEAVAAERLLGGVLNYKNGKLDGVKVILVAKPGLIDSGAMGYIFLLKSDRDILERFFYCKKDGLNADFIIVVNDDIKTPGIPAQPDLSFLTHAVIFNGYFSMRYPGISISEGLLRYMRGFFQTFRTVDYFSAGGMGYYLCINPSRERDNSQSKHQ